MDVVEEKSETSSDEEEIGKDESSLPYEEPAPFFSVYNIIRMAMGFFMNLFFKDISILGLQNIPKKGPIIIYGNHANQYCDGCIQLSSSSRDVRFMVAASSMRKPIIGTLFKLAKSIPVERPQDLAVKGKGKLRFTDAVTVVGEGTKFRE